MAARGHATVDAGVIEQKASILTLTLRRSRIAPGRPGGSPLVDCSAHRHPRQSGSKAEALRAAMGPVPPRSAPKQVVHFKGVSQVRAAVGNARKYNDFPCIGYECQTFHLKKGVRRRHTLFVVVPG